MDIRFDQRFCSTPQAQPPMKPGLEQSALNSKSYDNLIHRGTYYDIHRRSLDAPMQDIENNIGNHNSLKEAQQIGNHLAE